MAANSGVGQAAATRGSVVPPVPEPSFPTHRQQQQQQPMAPPLHPMLFGEYTASAMGYDPMYPTASRPPGFSAVPLTLLGPHQGPAGSWLRATVAQTHCRPDTHQVQWVSVPPTLRPLFHEQQPPPPPPPQHRQQYPYQQQQQQQFHELEQVDEKPIFGGDSSDSASWRWAPTLQQLAGDPLRWEAASLPLATGYRPGRADEAARSSAPRHADAPATAPPTAGRTAQHGEPPAVLGRPDAGPVSVARSPARDTPAAWSTAPPFAAMLTEYAAQRRAPVPAGRRDVAEQRCAAHGASATCCAPWSSITCAAARSRRCRSSSRWSRKSPTATRSGAA